MSPLDKDEVLALYVSLLAEVKARFQYIHWSANQVPFEHRTIANFQGSFSSAIAAEACYLQLRRSTELIAMAVLAAHNEDPAFRTKTLTKEYSADKILNDLQKLSQSAMPEPVFTDLWNDEPPEMLLSKGIVDVRKLVGEIYQKAGDKLHSGHFRFVASQRDKHYSFDFIQKSLDDLVQLLDHHIIILPNGNMMAATLCWQTEKETRARWIDLEWPTGVTR